jgi:hypothetical protein
MKEANMKTHYLLPVLCLLAACGTFAADKPKIDAPEPTLRLAVLPLVPLVPGKATTLELKLTDIKQRQLLTDDDLQTVHTKKIHLLVIDPTLSDYQHLHPVPTATRGVYSVAFTPKLADGYRLWADVTPVGGQQVYAMAELGADKPGAIDKTERHEATVDGYHFTLSFDEKLVEDKEIMGMVHITDAAGKPVKLQEIMGAYGHIVGFYSDFRNVVHTHPMGGADSELMFHLVPYKPGFIKLFVQVKIGGREIFAPFGINVGKPS